MSAGSTDRMLALEYALAADQDLDAIADYYEDQDAWQVALDVPERIREAAKLICQTRLASRGMTTVSVRTLKHGRDH